MVYLYKSAVSWFLHSAWDSTALGSTYSPRTVHIPYTVKTMRQLLHVHAYVKPDLIRFRNSSSFVQTAPDLVHIGSGIRNKTTPNTAVPLTLQIQNNIYSICTCIIIHMYIHVHVYIHCTHAVTTHVHVTYHVSLGQMDTVVLQSAMIRALHVHRFACMPFGMGSTIYRRECNFK